MSLIEPSAENPFQQSEEDEKQGANKQQQPQQRSLADSMDGVTIGVPSNGALPTLTVSQAPATPAFLFAPSVPSGSRSAVPPPTTDGILTPRTLARKIAAHQTSLANADEDLFAPADGDAPAPDFPAAFGGPSFPMDDPDAPRFQSSVGQSRVKGDGLDAHTRYEIQTRWKQSLVKASEDAFAQHKAQKQAAEAAEDQEAPSSPSAAAAQSNAAPPLKIPALSKCQRRYTDFRFLQTLLTQLYPAYLIPALPPKGLLQRFDEDFVAERRRGLQRFLADLSALPPPLCDEFVIMQFLLYSTVDWEATMLHLQATHGIGSVKAMGGAAWSFTSKLFNHMVRPTEDHSHDAFHAAQKESAEHHAALKDSYDYFNTKASALVEAERNIAENWLRFMPDYDGAGLGAGGGAADESLKASKIAHIADTLGLDFACFLPVTTHIGRLVGGSSVSAESLALVELIQHSTAMMGQIQDLLKRRSVLSAAVATAEAESRAADQSLDTMKRRVIMGDKTAEDESRATSHATQCAAIVRDRRSELDKFHASAESQLRAYTARRRADLKQALANFVRAQLDTEARVRAHWEACLHDMNKQQ